jgi:catechol 2,3-dioxygenase-like lactoylglutathione lyase family enzyme
MTLLERGPFDRFFQLGYVTRDLEAAIASYKARFGRTDFLRLPIAKPADGSGDGVNGIAIGYAGPVMIEIIEVNPGAPSIFRDALGGAAQDLRLHHLGYLVDDHQATLARLAELKLEVPMSGSSGDALDFCYADTREQRGHFSEFIRLGEQGRALFASLPGAAGKLP